MSHPERIAGKPRIMPLIAGVGTGVACLFLLYAAFSDIFGTSYYSAVADAVVGKPFPVLPKLDTADYDRRMLMLALATTTPLDTQSDLTGQATASTSTSSPQTATSTMPAKAPLWPAKTVYPNAGALLPFHRIVAYYGNFYSTGMGVLGQYPEDEVLAKLDAEVAVWNAADPTTPVIPAVEYIDVTAQSSPGDAGKYRLRMPDNQIERALAMAQKVDGIVILDIQVGLSTLQSELPLLEAYLKMPNVHIALDPEFSMKGGERPGTVIGTFDAADINYAAQYLAKIVRENNLPPKILIVHRFTQAMVTNYKEIEPLPEVQIVMDMDGWGPPGKKIGTYNAFIYPEPVQFTGVKLFYKNDLKPPSTRMLTPEEILNFKPRPIYIQYQ